MPRLVIAVVAALAFVVAACGSDNQPQTTPKPGPAADLGAITDYLLEHTAALNTSVGRLQHEVQAYYDLAKSVNFDYARLLQTKRAEAATAIREIQGAHIEANPNY